MTKNEKKPAPTHRGSIGVSAWTKTDKNGKSYLSVKLDNYVNLFEVREG